MARKRTGSGSSDDTGGGDSGGFDLKSPDLLCHPDMPEDLKNLPKARVGGEYNPEHYRIRIARVNWICDRAVASGEDVPFRADAYVARILAEAKVAGMSESSVADLRTPFERTSDFLDKITEAHERILEYDAEQMIDDLEATFAHIDKVCEDALETRVGAFRQRVDDAREREGKAFRGLLKRVSKLQAKIRDPQWNKKNRPAIVDTDEDRNFARDAGRVLRFMVYVRRPPEGKTTNGLFDIGTHHGIMAFDLALAKERAFVSAAGLSYGVTQCEGIIEVVPPGHGKTEMGVAEHSLALCDNSSLRILVGHAQKEKAADLVKAMRATIGLDTPEGRRARALFPKLPMFARFGNNATTITFLLKNHNKQPAVRGYGIQSKISGSDADRIWFDDQVDQNEVANESERNRTFDTINGTWMRRLRRGTKGAKGERTFHYTTTTLWHHDDANARRIALAKAGKAEVLVSVQRAGGPADNFRPLWPEVWPAAALRRVYNEMRNPRLYSACYMANPQPDELRIVGALRFYDPASQDHLEFLANAEYHLSVDPAATDREKSDRAGLAYAAVGDHIESRETGEGRETSSVRRKLRFLDFRQFHATQSMLVEACGNYAEGHRVDMVHVETRSGFQGCAEMFEMRFDWSPVRHDPKNQKKEIRLRSAAAVLDGSVKDENGYVACVEFPGIYNESGELVCDPQFEWVVRQILDFGVCPEDHCLDAITQLVNWAVVEGKLSSAQAGTFSRRVSEKRNVPEKLKRMYESWEAQAKAIGNHNAEVDDWNFIGSMN